MENNDGYEAVITDWDPTRQRIHGDGRTGRRIAMQKASYQEISTTKMFEDLLSIFVSTINNLNQASTSQVGGLNSRQINDMSKLVATMTMLNKEIRETTKDSNTLQGLSFPEQLQVVMEALKKIGAI